MSLRNSYLIKRLSKISLVSPIINSNRQFHSSFVTGIKTGDAVPNIPLYGKSPGDEIDFASIVSKGKHLLVFVPGAYSPGCSARHVPGYISLAQRFKAEKGISGIYIIARNDAFVMSSWASELGDADGKISYLADPSLAFASSLDLGFDATKIFGDYRTKRAAVLIQDGKVSNFWIEPDNTSITVSEADKVIDKI